MLLTKNAVTFFLLLWFESRLAVVRASPRVSSSPLPHREQNISGAGGGDGRRTVRRLHVLWTQTGTAGSEPIFQGCKSLLRLRFTYQTTILTGPHIMFKWLLYVCLFTVCLEIQICIYSFISFFRRESTKHNRKSGSFSLNFLVNNLVTKT